MQNSTSQTYYVHVINNLIWLSDQFTMYVSPINLTIFVFPHFYPPVVLFFPASTFLSSAACR